MIFVNWAVEPTTISGNGNSFDDCHVGLLYKKPLKTINKDKRYEERIYKTVNKDKRTEERIHKTANEGKKQEERIHERRDED